MILRSEEIKLQRNKGHIIIEPFNESQVQPNSYDIRLGNWVIRQDNNFNVIDLVDGKESNLWEEPQYYDNDKIISILPHEFLLSHSLEIIGTLDKFSTLLKSRSTIARLGLDICASAGFGDVGYVNKWTLEIKNNTNKLILLTPGIKIAQIAFIKLIGKGKKYNSIYNPDSFSDWKPEKMLPRVSYSRLYK